MRWAFTVVLLLSAIVAQADDLASARIHYDAGVRLYRHKRLRDAIAEFEKGYAISHKPRFLIDIGHCHLELDERDQAAEVFRRFLAEAPAADPQRISVERDLAAVDKPHADEPPIVAPAITPAEAPIAPVAPPVVVPQPIAPAVTNSLVMVPPHRRPLGLRHLAWAIPTLVVVGVGVGLGVYYGTRDTACSKVTLGCSTLPVPGH